MTIKTGTSSDEAQATASSEPRVTIKPRLPQIRTGCDYIKLHI
jgi:hypothetical protein